MPRLHEKRWKSGDRRLWRGTLESIPKGWVIDDDTKDRAVVGAGNDYECGQTFGADSKASDNKTLSEANLPPHRHSYSQYSGAGGSPGLGGYGGGSRMTGYTGGGEPFSVNVDTRQQSVALYVIRRL